MFGIGFCDKHYDKNSMSGWGDFSFGYHGDDGCLFINNGTAGIPIGENDTGVKYGAGDTVGVGLDLETGLGFLTKDGREVHVRNAFESNEFKRRKMYPCIGFDSTKDGVGLKFELNLGDAQEKHPFKFKGPYGSSRP